VLAIAYVCVILLVDAIGPIGNSLLVLIEDIPLC
jgi:hypothetical protein